MHEMSVAMSLLELAEAEAARQGCNRILRVRVEYGSLSGLLPESLDFCFNAIIRGTRHEGAVLELAEIPLLLRCTCCGARFGGEGRAAIWQPCPNCGENIAHNVERGRELILAQLEAIRE